jgi:hypothetical protein
VTGENFAGAFQPPWQINNQWVMGFMHNDAPDTLFRTLADPTRRATFEPAAPRRRADGRSRRSAEQDGSMTRAAADTHTLVVERVMPHPPEKIWRALTQSALIGEWLMPNDFEPVVPPILPAACR